MTPDLTDADKAVIRETIREMVPELMKLHADNCVLGKRLNKAFLIIFGVAIGTGVMGGSTAISLLSACPICALKTILGGG